MVQKSVLTLIQLFFCSLVFSQYHSLNVDSIRNSLKPGEIKSVVQILQGDSVVKQQIINNPTEGSVTENRYIIRFSAKPLKATTLKSTAAIRELEEQHEQFKTDLGEILKKSGSSTLKSANYSITHEFKNLINGVALSIPESALPEIKKLKYVLKVEKDEIVRFNDESSNNAINAPKVWRDLGFTGMGVTIAIVDTGVDTAHVCFAANKFVKGYDFANNDDLPFDDNMHGTHCAGIAAANAGQIKGVAPDAKIMPVKVMNKDGWGYNSWIIAGIEYAVDPDGNPSTSDGAQVLSLSLGGNGYPDDAMSEAVDNAVLNGVVCVVAAGNAGSGYYSIQSPGCARNALTVGSCSNTGTTSIFSSRGPSQITQAVKPEVSAPGENIYSSTPGDNYESLSGTSMATPHVAGLAALILQKNPDWRPENVKSAMIQSAKKYSGEVLEEGFGMVDAYNALRSNVFVAPYLLDLGVLDPDQGVAKVSRSIQITNPTDEVLELSFSKGDDKEGISMSFSPASIILLPNRSKSVQVTMSVSPQIQNSDLIPMHSSEIRASDGYTSYKIPIVWLAGKLVNLSFGAQPNYCTIYNSDWTSSFQVPMTEDACSLVLGRDRTDIIAMFNLFTHMILKQDIQKLGSEILLDPNEAKNEIKVNASSPNGQRLNLLVSGRESLNIKGKPWSGYNTSWFTIVTNEDQNFKDFKRYFNAIPDSFVYEVGLTAMPSFNHDIKQIIYVPVGLDQGINQSQEILVTPSDYRKLSLKFDLGSGHDSLFYTTDFGMLTGNLLRDPFLTEIQRINPQNVFDYYFLKMPYESFHGGGGTMFSFWEKLPDGLPIELPKLRTPEYILNRSYEFQYRVPSNSTWKVIPDKKQVLSANLRTLANFPVNNNVLDMNYVQQSGTYTELYADTLEVVVANGRKVTSKKALETGYSYQYTLPPGYTTNVPQGDTVFCSATVPFDKHVQEKLNYYFVPKDKTFSFSAFPESVGLEGDIIQDKYVIPGNNNTVLVSTMKNPQLWTRKKGQKNWIPLAVQRKDIYTTTSAPIVNYEPGYYDLKVLINSEGSSSVAQWSPAFFICDAIQADSLCLVELYRDCGGENWTNKLGWLKDKLANWQGVKIENGRVTEINLAKSNLVGTVPARLVKLDNLTRMNFSQNALDSIPDFSSLTHLSEFNVSNNKLDFSSIVPNKLVSGFNFESQDSLIITGDTRILVDETERLAIKSQTAGNKYQWLKDGNLIGVTDSSKYSFITESMTNSGVYTALVTNAAIPDFYIPARKIKVDVSQKYFEPDRELSFESFSLGVSASDWVDVDLDGDEDLFLANWNYGGSQLFINQFKETGKASFVGLKDDSIYPMALSACSSNWIDYNNDGLEDLIIIGDRGMSETNPYENEDVKGCISLNIFENQGDLKFKNIDIGGSVGKTTFEEFSGLGIGDFNGDNYLDLIVNYLEWKVGRWGVSKSLRLINNKSGFDRITQQCPSGLNGSILFADILGDKTDEMLTTNWTLNISNGNFNEGCPAELPGYYMINTRNNPSIGDFDNDGDLDIFYPVNHFFAGNHESYHNIYLENRKSTLVENKKIKPVIGSVLKPSGSVCFDFDNDGDLDLAVANNGGTTELYKNLSIEKGALEFEPIIDVAFGGELDYWIGISASDIDLDGYMDLTQVSNSGVSFLHNNLEGNNWISLNCKGKISNKSAIGAKVHVVARIKGKRVNQYRQILAASGQASLTSKQLHFGLGDAAKIDSLIIDWPSGTHNVLTNLEVNRFLTIEECINPNPVVGLRATYSKGTITLDWTNPSFSDGRYIIEMIDTNNEELMVMDTISVDETSWEMNCEGDYHYYFRMRTVSDCGSEAKSHFIQVHFATDAEDQPFLPVVYPNPADRYIYIGNIAFDKKSIIYIYDMNGYRVESFSPDPGVNLPRIDVSCLPAGTYLLEILTGVKSYSEKILVR